MSRLSREERHEARFAIEERRGGHGGTGASGNGNEKRNGIMPPRVA